MKISGRKPYQPVNPLGGSQETSKTDKSDKVSKSTGSGADSIDFSDTSKNILNVKKAVMDMPDIRTEKVSEIRTALDGGEYHVESEKIAKKLVDEALNESLRRKK